MPSSLARTILATCMYLSPTAAQVLPADEVGVQSTLRGLASGQITYAVVCANGFYAPTFADLGRPQPGEKMGFILDTDVPPKGATVLEKYRYRIEFTAPPSPTSPASCNGVPAGRSASSWSATARPMPGFSGRAFRIDHEGTLTVVK